MYELSDFYYMLLTVFICTIVSAICHINIEDLLEICSCDF